MSRDKGFWPRVSKAGIAPRCPDMHQGRFLVSHDSAEISVISSPRPSSRTLALFVAAALFLVVRTGAHVDTFLRRLGRDAEPP